MKNEIEIKKTEITYSNDDIQLIKESYCRGATDQEFNIFLAVANARGLNILTGQVYSIPRTINKGKSTERMVRTIQVGIDGLRAIAQRSGQCLGISAPRYQYVANPLNGKPTREILCCKVVVKRAVGTHVGEFEGLVYKDERRGQLHGIMPHTMIGKCAEAEALRKAFPEEIGQFYVPEEMAQEEEAPAVEKVTAEVVDVVEINSDARKAELLDELAEWFKKRCEGKSVEEKGRMLYETLGVKSWAAVKAMKLETLEKVKKSFDIVDSK